MRSDNVVSGHGPTMNTEHAKIQIIVTIKDSTQRESGRLRVLIVAVIALRPDLKARLGLKQASLASE
jgi:hypothetical protein